MLGALRGNVGDVLIFVTKEHRMGKKAVSYMRNIGRELRLSIRVECR